MPSDRRQRQIAAHQNLAKDNAMLGMMVNAEITAPSLAVFVRGTHEVGAFIELLAQHQRVTENKKVRRTSFGFCMCASLGWPTDMSPLVKWSTQAPVYGRRYQQPSLRILKLASSRIRRRLPPHKPTQTTISPR